MFEFTGAAAPLSSQGVEACTQRLSVQSAEIWTVLTVETRGCGFFEDRRPAILFERHIFHRLTGGRFGVSDISNPRPGGYTGGVGEYDRLAKALALDETAALKSASWGISQVMGFHAEALGYGSVQEFVSEMVASEDKQLAAFASFILNSKLDEALRGHAWARFARGYNGPGYEKNQYDQRLARAYERLTTKALPDLSVREAQIRLMFLGLNPGTPDGYFGRRTGGAMTEFQRQQGLPVTSSLDEATLQALRDRCAALK